MQFTHKHNIVRGFVYGYNNIFVMKARHVFWRLILRECTLTHCFFLFLFVLINDLTNLAHSERVYVPSLSCVALILAHNLHHPNAFWLTLYFLCLLHAFYNIFGIRMGTSDATLLADFLYSYETDFMQRLPKKTIEKNLTWCFNVTFAIY
jgi:hypothetical protein